MSHLWLLCGHQLCKAARAWSPAMQRQTHPGDGRAAVEIPVIAVARGRCADLNGRPPRAGRPVRADAAALICQDRCAMSGHRARPLTRLVRVSDVTAVSALDPEDQKII